MLTRSRRRPGCSGALGAIHLFRWDRDAVEEFVGAGGSAYLSGDLSYDELRLPSRADRFVPWASALTPRPLSE